MTQYIAGHAVVDGSVPPGFGRGYIPRDKQAYPLGCLKFAKSAPAIKEMTDAEIMEAIAAKTAAKSWITDHFDRLGIIVKNQQNSNYCHAHAAVRCCEAVYVFSGGLHVPLSAFDVGAGVTGGRNAGGSGVEDVQWIAKNGVCTEALHKPMDFSANRSAAQSANAALHKVEACDDLDPSAHRLIASYICNDISVTVGIPAWSHEVEIAYLVADGGTWYFGIENSWGPNNYGVNGRGLLKGVYSEFDEAMAVRLMTPANQ